jgi:hypothetical protein
MNCELEAQIGAIERAFDRARDRVDQLEFALRAAENALDRECVEFFREKTRKQIKRIEFDLASARNEMASVRGALEGAWALRNKNGEEQ